MTRAIAGPLRTLLSVSAWIAVALTAGRAMAGSPGKGTYVARDEITAILDGCVILERYGAPADQLPSGF